MLLMFMGRVGGLTFVYAFLSSNGRTNSKLPLENIMVG
jgi:trk system potassium uptake protein TrkH